MDLSGIASSRLACGIALSDGDPERSVKGGKFRLNL
jgi:hypothetical protein